MKCFPAHKLNALVPKFRAYIQKTLKMNEKGQKR